MVSLMDAALKEIKNNYAFVVRELRLTPDPATLRFKMRSTMTASRDSSIVRSSP